MGEVHVLELAWNTQKNKITDVKGKEREQERKGKIKNEDIDTTKTKHNYDLVQSDLNLYQRVKKRVEYAKKTGSRVQKNSVVMYSNILTVPKEQADVWGEEKTNDYFKACFDFFAKEFGKENVVSAKVHLDESAPHMHLHFVPFNKETGKLQARTAMNPKRIHQIHSDLSTFLQERGFDVVRGSGKTSERNIKDIHEYKAVQQKISEKQKELEQMSKVIPASKKPIPFVKKEKQKEVVKKSLFHKEEQEKETGNYILSAKQYEQMTEMMNAAVALKNYYETMRTTDLAVENKRLREKLAKETAKRKNMERENEDLKAENFDLKKENRFLKRYTDILRSEIAVTYKTTKNFIKEHTEDVSTFKSALNVLVNQIKEKYLAFHQKNGNPGKSELEQIHERASSRNLKKKHDMEL